MAEKETVKTNTSKSSAPTYTISEVLKITDNLFKLSKEKEYPPWCICPRTHFRA